MGKAFLFSYSYTFSEYPDTNNVFESFFLASFLQFSFSCFATFQLQKFMGMAHKYHSRAFMSTCHCNAKKSGSPQAFSSLFSSSLYSDTFDKLIPPSFPVPIAYGLRFPYSVLSLIEQRNERRWKDERYLKWESFRKRSYLMLCACHFLESLDPFYAVDCKCRNKKVDVPVSMKDIVFILTNPDRNMRVFLAHTLLFRTSSARSFLTVH